MIDPSLTWNTFHGSTNNEFAYGVFVDASGNIYVTGTSGGSWGSNIKRAYSSGDDGFVVKLDSSGNYQWNAFFGTTGTDEGQGINVDGSGNVYVTGTSGGNWTGPSSEAPLRAFQGTTDPYIAKLTTNGDWVWHTFLGSAGNIDQGWAITLDSSGNVYVAGRGDSATWTGLGTPVQPHSGGADGFAAKLNSSGAVQWYTFMGGTGTDESRGIIVDSGANSYISGASDETWGSPINPHSSAGDDDAFVTKLNSTGVRQWNTFMGAASTNDWGRAITMDGSGNIYVTGSSGATWGSPIRSFQGSLDGFVSKLNNSGVRQWNTFLGGTATDYGYGLFEDPNGYLYAVGYSAATWGSPLNAYIGSSDIYLARLDTNGSLNWNTFMGSTNQDRGQAVMKDPNGNVAVAGGSLATWGRPGRLPCRKLGRRDSLLLRPDNRGCVVGHLSSARRLNRPAVQKHRLPFPAGGPERDRHRRPFHWRYLRHNPDAFRPLANQQFAIRRVPGLQPEQAR